jgi:hypothetical protein
MMAKSYQDVVTVKVPDCVFKLWPEFSVCDARLRIVADSSDQDCDWRLEPLWEEAKQLAIDRRGSGFVDEFFVEFTNERHAFVEALNHSSNEDSPRNIIWSLKRANYLLENWSFFQNYCRETTYGFMEGFRFANSSLTIDDVKARIRLESNEVIDYHFERSDREFERKLQLDYQLFCPEHKHWHPLVCNLAEAYYLISHGDCFSKLDRHDRGTGSQRSN